MPEENGETSAQAFLKKSKKTPRRSRILQGKGQRGAGGPEGARKTQLFRSIFRVKHDETPRNRALSVLTNVFFHLHPAKINRDAVRYSYTWGMGVSLSTCSWCSPLPVSC